MSRRDPKASLVCMRDHARHAITFVAGRTRGDLNSGRMLELALTQVVTIVGRAAARVDLDSRARWPWIASSHVVAFRDQPFDQIDLDRLWQTATADLPQLVGDVERALREL